MTQTTEQQIKKRKKLKRKVSLDIKLKKEKKEKKERNDRPIEKKERENKAKTGRKK